MAVCLLLSEPTFSCHHCKKEGTSSKKAFSIPSFRLRPTMYKKTKKRCGRTHTPTHSMRHFSGDGILACAQRPILTLCVVIDRLSVYYTTLKEVLRLLHSVLHHATKSYHKRRRAGITKSRGHKDQNIRQIFCWVYPSEDEQAPPSVRTGGVSKTTHWSGGNVWRRPVSRMRVVKV